MTTQDAVPDDATLDALDRRLRDTGCWISQQSGISWTGFPLISISSTGFPLIAKDCNDAADAIAALRAALARATEPEEEGGHVELSD